MVNYVYETHNMDNPLLPFIFHRKFVVASRHSLPNWHENIELLHCIGGKGFIRCGKDSYPFMEGDIFLVNANTPHCICSEGSVIYRCLIVDNSFGLANGIHLPSLHFENTIRSQELNLLFDAIDEAFQQDLHSQPLTIASIRHMVLGILCILCKEYQTEKPNETVSASSGYVKSAIEYIRKNLASALTLDDIADHVGISKFHLSREFKNFTGKTIVQTVNLIRCVEAKRLIEGGNSVSASAEICGFDNLSYFSKIFKRTFGKLPSSYLTTAPSGIPITTVPNYDEDICY